MRKMANWSEKIIQETLEFWQPKYDKMGVKLTKQDAIEILDNLTNYVNLLYKWELEETAEKS